MSYKPLYYDTSRHFVFLGNGLNRAFKNNDGWEELLHEKFENVPLPLCFSLDKRLIKKELAERLNENVYSEELAHYIRKLVEVGFTDFITTNYSYEIEYSLIDEKHRNLNFIKSKSFNLNDNVVSKGYICSTYFETVYQNKIIRVFHIHGECRRPSSIVLTQSDYAKSIQISFENPGYPTAFKLDNYGYDLHTIRYKSWVDLIILNNIYFLGYGLSFYEFDVWTALEKRYGLEKQYNHIHYFSAFENNLNPETRIVFGKFGIKILPSFAKQMDDSKYKSAYLFFLELLKNKGFELEGEML